MSLTYYRLYCDVLQRMCCVHCFVQTSTKLANESVGQEPISHWQSRLTINIVSEHISFDPRNIPGELYRYLQ